MSNDEPTEENERLKYENFALMKMVARLVKEQEDWRDMLLDSMKLARVLAEKVEGKQSTTESEAK